MTRNIVFGFLGTQLDAGNSAKRWERWRPTVGLFGQPDFEVEKLELFTCKHTDGTLAAHVTADIATVSPAAQVTVHDLGIEDPWDFVSVYAALLDFAKGYAFEPGCNYYVHLSTGSHVAQICLFLLTETRYYPAKLLGLRKAAAGEPWQGRSDVIDLDLSTYDQLASRFRKEGAESQDLLKGGIATRNAAFNALIARMEKVSLRSAAPILLTGPTGAGKTLLAERIYQLRARKHLATGAFIEVNCATLRGDNAMSALFGHKKGAYTGATSDRAGLLKAAGGGMLFLDEIGELGLDEQAMLLRALEQKKFLPLGSDKEVNSDFQLLAGTNKDLACEVANGCFRADLLTRINLWTFSIPGLAERPEDIEPNLAFELERVSEELGMNVSMNSDAREAFLRAARVAAWPGNFRDFHACVLRMATLCEGGRIRLDDVQLETAALAQHAASRGPAPSAGYPLSERVLGTRAAALDVFDLAQLEAVLGVVSGAKSLADAGRGLFAVSRQDKAKSNDSDRVKKFLARFGLEFLSLKQALA